MQQMWKWLRKPVIGVSALLLMGGLGYAFAGLAGMALPWGPRLARAEAAIEEAAWPRWVHPGTAIVPILSAGSPGIRLGLAQVSGPRRRVDQVKAVLQIDGQFDSIRGKLLIPSNSYTSLDRVQGTAVTAILQYELMNFSAHHKAEPAPEKHEEHDNCPPKHEEQDHHDRDQGHHYGWYKHDRDDDHRDGND